MFKAFAVFMKDIATTLVAIFEVNSKFYLGNWQRIVDIEDWGSNWYN